MVKKKEREGTNNLRHRNCSLQTHRDEAGSETGIQVRPSVGLACAV